MESSLLCYLVSALEKWSLQVMMVEVYSYPKTAHFLFVVIQYHELSLDAIIFSNQLKERYFNVAQSEVTLTVFWTILVKVMANFKHCSLRLKIIEDFSVHLDGELVIFRKHRAQTVV